MAPRKTKVVKIDLPKKTPVPRTQKPNVMSSSSARDQIRPYPTSEGLEDMMGDETDDSNQHSTDFTNQSRPNFSFLPSHKHSSPHKIGQTNMQTVHRLASMSTVPNMDLVQYDTSNEPSASYDTATPRTSSSRIKPPKESKRTKVPQKQGRKQKTPNKLKCLQDIVALQGTVHHLIPKLSFGRIIREILSDFSSSHLRVTVDMLQCLQEAAEIYVVQLFEDAYRCTIHRNRLTLIPKDMQLALMIRRES